MHTADVYLVHKMCQLRYPLQMTNLCTYHGSTALLTDVGFRLARRRRHEGRELLQDGALVVAEVDVRREDERPAEAFANRHNINCMRICRDGPQSIR